jgi:hypothetical protein
MKSSSNGLLLLHYYYYQYSIVINPIFLHWDKLLIPILEKPVASEHVNTSVAKLYRMNINSYRIPPPLLYGTPKSNKFL